MKKIFFLTIIISSVLVVRAGDKDCKLKIKKNEFTGAETIEGEQIKIISVFPMTGSKSPWNLNLCFYSWNDTPQIYLIHASQGLTSNVRLIHFKFTDGTVISKTVGYEGGRSNNGKGYRFESTLFLITKEEVQKFAATRIAKFAFEFLYFPESPSVEKEIKESAAEEVQMAASCFLKEMK